MNFSFPYLPYPSSHAGWVQGKAIKLKIIYIIAYKYILSSISCSESETRQGIKIFSFLPYPKFLISSNLYYEAGQGDLIEVG